MALGMKIPSHYMSMNSVVMWVGNIQNHGNSRAAGRVGTFCLENYLRSTFLYIRKSPCVNVDSLPREFQRFALGYF